MLSERGVSVATERSAASGPTRVDFSCPNGVSARVLLAINDATRHPKPTGRQRRDRPAIDPIQTAALAVEIVPESVSRDANADLPMVEAYRAAPAVVPADLGAFLLATGNRLRPAAHSSPANSMMAAALAVRPHTIGSRPAPAEDPPAPAFDPNAPIAYADPARIEDFEAPFRALIDAPAKPEMDIHQPDPAADHDWVTNPIPRRAKSVAEKRCLAEAIYFEARSEPIRGQLAVAQVVVNRLKNPAYPGTICGVVYQNRQYRNACQFSFACDGVRDVIRDHPAWERPRNSLAPSSMAKRSGWKRSVRRPIIMPIMCNQVGRGR